MFPSLRRRRQKEGGQGGEDDTGLTVLPRTEHEAAADHTAAAVLAGGARALLPLLAVPPRTGPGAVLRGGRPAVLCCIVMYFTIGGRAAVP